MNLDLKTCNICYYYIPNILTHLNNIESNHVIYSRTNASSLNYFQVMCYKWIFPDVVSKIISQMCLIINLKHVNDILTRYIINKLLNEYCTISIWPNNTDTRKLVSVLLGHIDIVQYSFNNL